MKIGDYDRYLNVIEVTSTRDGTTGQPILTSSIVGQCWAMVDEFSGSESEVAGVTTTQVSGEIRIHGIIGTVKANGFLSDPQSGEEWEIQGVTADRKENETVCAVIKYQETP